MLLDTAYHPNSSAKKSFGVQFVQSTKSFFFFSTMICLGAFTLIGCGGAASNTTAQAAPPNPPSSPAPAASPTPAPSASPTPTPTPTPVPTPAVPANAIVASKIEDMPEWQWCTAETTEHKPCASGLGNAVSWKANNQSQPSRDGSSAQFHVAGATGYSNALWWRFLEPNPALTHFNYDVWFYIDNPEVSQALEFDVNQSFNGTRYTWGSECNFKGTGKWDVWDPQAAKWVPSAVDCPVFSANVWHHLLWQLERVNGQVHYISLTVDDQEFPVNIYKNPQANWNADEIDVAFQMDGDAQQTPYNVWLDEVTLTQW